jgi:hypothetical protein
MMGCGTVRCLVGAALLSLMTAKAARPARWELMSRRRLRAHALRSGQCMGRDSRGRQPGWGNTTATNAVRRRGIPPYDPTKRQALQGIAMETAMPARTAMVTIALVCINAPGQSGDPARRTTTTLHRCGARRIRPAALQPRASMRLRWRAFGLSRRARD